MQFLDNTLQTRKCKEILQHQSLPQPISLSLRSQAEVDSCLLCQDIFKHKDYVWTMLFYKDSIKHVTHFEHVLSFVVFLQLRDSCMLLFQTPTMSWLHVQTSVIWVLRCSATPVKYLVLTELSSAFWPHQFVPLCIKRQQKCIMMVFVQ